MTRIPPTDAEKKIKYNLQCAGMHGQDGVARLQKQRNG